MLTQLFKIMWQRKGKNFLLLTEIFFSFLVLFLTGTFIIEGVINYYSSAGFDYADVYDLDIVRHGESNTTSIAKLQQMKEVLKSNPEINDFSLSFSNTPFSHSNMSVDFDFGGKAARSNRFVVEASYLETMDMEMAEGRWFQKGDVGSPLPAVINEHLRNEVYPDEQVIGKRFTSDGGKREFQIVGVVKGYRQDGELSAPESAMFEMFNEKDTAWAPSNILLEIKAGANPAWKENLLDQLQPIAGDWTLDLSSLPELRANKAKMKLMPMIALCVVCGFLIFNVSLGLFGVLWQNINKRYAEIGIRRALGATESAVRRQMLGEVVVLATLGQFLGVLLALQFPLLGVMNVEASVYAMAITAALFLIYLLVIICAWYPSRQAAKIEPALALHYE